LPQDRRHFAGAVSTGETLVPSRTRDTAAYLDFLRAKVAARPRGAAALGTRSASSNKW